MEHNEADGPLGNPCRFARAVFFRVLPWDTHSGSDDADQFAADPPTHHGTPRSHREYPERATKHAPAQKS